MNITVNQLRQFRTQEYDPTIEKPVPSYIEQYGEKEFNTGNLAEIFHENTKYTDVEEFQLGPSAGLFTRDDSYSYMQANLAPDYDGTERINLPQPEPLPERLDVMLSRRRSRRNHSGEGISLQQLSTLLQYGCGVTEEKQIGQTDKGIPVNKPHRSYASGGGLYPVEIYILVSNPGPDLPTGLYYYAAEDHVLRVLERDEKMGERLADAFALSEDIYDPTDAAVSFLLTGSFWRSMAKYGPRGYRFVLQESGHLAQNVLLVSESMNLAAVPLAGFVDDDLNELLGINGVDEAALYMVSVGQTGGEDDE